MAQPLQEISKGIDLVDLKHGKQRKWDQVEDEGASGSQSGKKGVEAEADEDLFVELFEMKEKVRRLEGEAWTWKERYLATSELVDMYERGQV